MFRVRRILALGPACLLALTACSTPQAAQEHDDPSAATASSTPGNRLEPALPCGPEAQILLANSDLATADVQSTQGTVTTTLRWRPGPEAGWSPSQFDSALDGLRARLDRDCQQELASNIRWRVTAVDGLPPGVAGFTWVTWSGSSGDVPTTPTSRAATQVESGARAYRQLGRQIAAVSITHDKPQPPTSRQLRTALERQLAIPANKPGGSTPPGACDHIPDATLTAAGLDQPGTDTSLVRADYRNNRLGCEWSTNNTTLRFTAQVSSNAREDRSQLATKRRDCPDPVAVNLDDQPAGGTGFWCPTNDGGTLHAQWPGFNGQIEITGHTNARTLATETLTAVQRIDQSDFTP